MNAAGNNYFLAVIFHLRSQEEVMVYDRFTPIKAGEELPVAGFLQEEYERERLNFPGIAPPFDSKAAVWAAGIVYMAAQLLLHRQKEEADLGQTLPFYAGVMTPGAILSVDLCLRCLPDILGKAKDISPDDVVIPLLERHLQRWPFSGVGYKKVETAATDAGGVEATDAETMEIILTNACLKQLYIDRIIGRRALSLAATPLLRPAVMAVMGDHAPVFWKELIETT